MGVDNRKIHCPEVWLLSVQNKFGLRFGDSRFRLNGEDLQFIPILYARFVLSLMVLVAMESFDFRRAVCCGMSSRSTVAAVSRIATNASAVTIL